MKLSEHIDGAREILDDRVEPYLVSDADLVRHFNDAVREACIRTRVVQDSSSDLCSLALTAGTATYSLDPAIFAVRRARIDGQRYPLELVDTSQLDEREPGWDDTSLTAAATPIYAMFDAHTGKMTVHPRPAVTGTLKLLVWRGPTENEQFDADDTDGECVLPEHMQHELKHWVAAMVMLTPDSDLNNPGLAATHMGLFEAAYGRKPDLHEIRLWSTNKRRRVRAHFD